MRVSVCSFLIAAITIVGSSSCKKDYTCVCKTTSGTVYNSQINTTKKKAKSFCDDQQTSTRTCTLQ